MAALTPRNHWLNGVMLSVLFSVANLVLSVDKVCLDLHVTMFIEGNPATRVANFASTSHVSRKILSVKLDQDKFCDGIENMSKYTLPASR